MSVLARSFFDRKVTYEVLAGEGSRWIIDSVHTTKSKAMVRAQALLESRQHDGVRVTREENDSGEEIVFQQEGAGKSEKPIAISPIDEASLCSEPNDLTAFEARITTGRILRQYLDAHGVTALEILHNHGHLRQLMRTENLFNQAIHRIASIQARSLGVAASERNDLLYRLAGEAADRVKDLEDTSGYLEIMKEKGLCAALQAVSRSFSPEYRPFFTCAMLGDFMGRERDWKKKLGLVLDLLERPTPEGQKGEAFTRLDEICAEIFDGSEAVKELLGPQPDLISALRAMAQLSAGRYKPRRKGNVQIERFNKAMARYGMPVTREILLGRVARAVSGVQPLTRESDRTDRAAFSALLGDLVRHGGLSGGRAMSEALTRRARVVMKSGDDDLSPEDGIDSILAMLPHQAARIGYLLDLTGSEFGVKHQANVMKTLLSVVQSITSLDGLLPPGNSAEDRVRTANDLCHRGGDLGREIGALISKKLDKLLKEKKAPDSPKKPCPPKKQAPEKPTKDVLKNRIYRAGEVIFREGDDGDEAYMILSGKIDITIKSAEEEIILATLERGEILGEMALVDDQPRMATATATAETSLSVIPREAFKKRLDWLAEEDRLISHILGIFVARLRRQAQNL